MNSPIIKRFLTSISLICLLSTSAQAGWLSKAKDQSLDLQVQSATSTSDVERHSQEELQTLNKTMTTQLTDIQTLLEAKRYQEAFTLAKQNLDYVRVQSGIDPKAKLHDNFLVPSDFPQGAVNMSGLPVAQQQQVIRTISDYRGGLYLDILNLAKRTTLLYIEAFHGLVSSAAEGGMNSEDRKKILYDLATVSIVPMTVQDKKGQTIIVFDNEVANDDQTYMFNREIKSYIVGTKDLGIDEATFDKYRDSLRGRGGSGDDSRLSNAEIFKTSNFATCHDRIGSEHDEEYTTRLCLESIKLGWDFNNSDFKSCMDRFMSNNYHVTYSVQHCQELLKK